MRKIDLGQTITILANVGVIAGIIFLGFELQQNQRMMMAQTRNEISRTSIELQQSNREPTQASVIVRGIRGESLTEEESFQFARWAAVTLEFWENVDYQYRQGLFDAEEYRAQLNRARNRLNSQSGLRDYFCARRDNFSASFVSAMDSILEQPCLGRH